ncbi:MAG: hypothetical protein ACOYNZ_02935 [Rhodoferax sp.]
MANVHRNIFPALTGCLGMACRSGFIRNYYRHAVAGSMDYLSEIADGEFIASHPRMSPFSGPCEALLPVFGVRSESAQSTENRTLLCFASLLAKPACLIVSVNSFEQLGHCGNLANCLDLTDSSKAVYVRAFP